MNDFKFIIKYIVLGSFYYVLKFIDASLRAASDEKKFSEENSEFSATYSSELISSIITPHHVKILCKSENEVYLMISDHNP